MSAQACTVQVHGPSWSSSTEAAHRTPSESASTWAMGTVWADPDGGLTTSSARSTSWPSRITSADSSARSPSVNLGA
ncbi:MAG: hypothetical protein R2746_03485 [Acidimicrobiales bacterium]